MTIVSERDADPGAGVVPKDRAVPTDRLVAERGAASVRDPVPRSIRSILGAILVSFALLNPLSITGQTPVPPEPWDDTISLEVWSAVDRVIHGDDPVEERFLREAQFTLSGMIYGFDFVYVPAYPARRVERLFEITPIDTIPWGDPSLNVRLLRDEGTTIYGVVDYTLSETDRQRLRSWRSIDVETSQGIATAPLLQGLDGKITSIEESIYRAIRDYLRGRYQNRPREVTGSVVLRDPPRIRTISGEYEALVDVAVHINEVRQYLSF